MVYLENHIYYEKFYVDIYSIFNTKLNKIFYLKKKKAGSLSPPCEDTAGRELSPEASHVSTLI